MKTRPPTTAYFAGLDLGRTHEFTALAVVERSQPADTFEPEDLTYAVRHLERFPPGTSYPQVFARLAELYATKPLVGSTLVVDRTAVGKPAVDALRRSPVRAMVREVTVAAGHAARRDDHGVWLVPRTELVGTLQVLLQAGRLRLADSLAEAETLVRELTAFRAEIAGTPDDAVAWREGTHDDLVLAVAIAAWEGERHGPTGNTVPHIITVDMLTARRWW